MGAEGGGEGLAAVAGGHIDLGDHVAESSCTFFPEKGFLMAS